MLHLDLRPRRQPDSSRAGCSRDIQCYRLLAERFNSTDLSLSVSQFIGCLLSCSQLMKCGNDGHILWSYFRCSDIRPPVSLQWTLTPDLLVK